MKPFSPTELYYEEGDVVGLLCCVASMLPYALAIVMATWYAAHECPDTMVAGVGVIASDVLNVILKKTIKEPRPSGLRDDYGMPSRHAQMTACICCLAYCQAVRDGVRRRRRTTPLFAALLLLVVAAVGFSRVYLNYHTAAQVVVGTLVGGGFAAAWSAYVRSPFHHRVTLPPLMAVHRAATACLRLLVVPADPAAGTKAA
eukprot:TRINITY_DN13410_c0_g1_i1.p1 TRINITY_DN13410_c0_g1~~TRINITY_DN13410_c0_g1_i1.p1  ORF type:complete len:216 (+),score=68.34 TRINITY_DN13410_c0_g1_i1:47-649(+)